MTRPNFVHPRERLLDFAGGAASRSSGVADDIIGLIAAHRDRATAAPTTRSRPRGALR